MNYTDVEFEPTEDDNTYLERVKNALEEGDHDEDIIRESLRVDEVTGFPELPNSVRGKIWCELLLHPNEHLSTWENSEAAETEFWSLAKRTLNELDEPLRELFLIDAKRTRPSLARFKGDAGTLEVAELLAILCKIMNVRYVQGMNEICAIFMMLPDIGTRPQLVCKTMSAFTRKFVPWVLESVEDDDSSLNAFSNLKFCFNHFGTLLQYHDPEVHQLLQRSGIPPHVYTTSWFVTMFARNFSVEATYMLWDAIIVGGDRANLYFFALALLLSRREDILQRSEAHLPEEMIKLAAKSREEVRGLWAWGQKLRAATPLSFITVVSRPYDAETDEHQMDESAAVMEVTVDDLFGPRSSKYLIWDCRTKQEFDAGKIARAAHLELDGLRFGSPEQAAADLRQALDLNEPLRSTSTQICLAGSGMHAEDMKDMWPLAVCLIKNGFRYVSVLSGGYDEVMQNAPEQLIDLDTKQADAARALRRRRKSRRNFLREQGFTSGVMAMLDKREEEFSWMLYSARMSFGRIALDLASLTHTPTPSPSLPEGEPSSSVPLESVSPMRSKVADDSDIVPTSEIIGGN